MKPIVKWVGGKTALVEELTKLITPESLSGHTYFEPFCGGAAMALYLRPERCRLNDLNPELINLYQTIARKPEELITLLTEYQAAHSKEFYYKIREQDRLGIWPELDMVHRAARMLYLNKTCFNGLYRVNKKGYFNTPIGRTTSGKAPDIVQAQQIRELSEYFRNSVNFSCGPWSHCSGEAREGDTVFFDPPYLQTFTDYTSEGFNLLDTQILRGECDRLDYLGVRWVVTNDNNDQVKSIFKGYEIQEVSVRHSINRNGNDRQASEVIITNIK